MPGSGSRRSNEYNTVCHRSNVVNFFLAGKPGYRAEPEDDEDEEVHEEDGADREEGPDRVLPAEEDPQMRGIPPAGEDPQMQGVPPAGEDPQMRGDLPAEEDLDRDLRKRARCTGCYSAAATREAKLNVTKVRFCYSVRT